MGIDPVTHNPRLDLLDLSSILGSSFYNPNYNSQINTNFSRLIGIHNSINPDVLRLANSFISSNNNISQRQTPNLLLQNVVEDQQHYNSDIISDQLLQLLPGQQQPSSHHHQLDQSAALPPLHEVSAGCSPSTTATSCGGEVQFLEPNNNNYYSASGQQLLFPSNFSDFYSQNCQHPNDEMASNRNNLNEFRDLECVQFPSYDFYGSNEEIHQQILDPSPETSTTPNSNSTYFSNGNGNGTDQDERESYCSEILKFEISDLLDVNPFM